jgi:hypothetical protein
MDDHDERFKTLIQEFFDDGIGVDVYEEHFWELCAVLFQYLYVGLPALDAIEYVKILKAQSLKELGLAH